jgi:hypothetical protein
MLLSHHLQTQSCILVLPTEAIEHICILVDEPHDLQSLTRVSRLFASVACHIYATRLGIRATGTSCLVHIQGISFQALAIWRRSRLFTCLEDKYLICDIDDSDIKLANTQIRALRHFLSTPFVGQPFVEIIINSADALSPSHILHFIQLIDRVGCQGASISSGLSNPEWLDLSSSSCTVQQAMVSVFNLRSLTIDNQYFYAQQWSSLLSHLTGQGLETLCIRGKPSIVALSKFLSRHPHIRNLRFQPRWATRDHCIKSKVFPHQIQMPQLSEIEGPPCHLRALLRCLLPTSPKLKIKIGCDSAMTYPEYIQAVLRSVRLCRPGVYLEIRLPSHYDPVFHQKAMQSPRNTSLPEVASLEIAFPPMSEGHLLVFFHPLFKTMLQS